MAQLILVSGKKRSGKDYFTTLLTTQLERQGYTVDVRAFADPMKEVLATTFGITTHQLDNYKNAMNRYKVCLVDMTDGDHGFSTAMRQILQRFGTEAMKPLFGDDVWANRMADFVANSKADYVIVPDFRFHIEHLKPSITIRILCNLAESVDTHISETELDDFKFDYEINNNNHQLRQHHVEYFVKERLLKHKEN